MPKTSLKSPETTSRAKLMSNYKDVSLFVVPLLQRAKDGLPDQSSESRILARIMADLDLKESGRFKINRTLRTEPTESRAIEHEEYKDVSTWVIPYLEEAITDLHRSAPEAAVLKTMIDELKKKELLTKDPVAPVEAVLV